MQNFARCGTWHLRFTQELNGLWSFVSGDPATTPFEYFRFACMLMLMQYDGSVYRFAPFVMGQANDRDIFYLWMCAQDAFDFRRVNILAATNNHIALAIN